jgi:beta-xylosidase
VAAGWSLTERPGWLRLKALPAEKPALAHNTLTQKLWDRAGAIDVKLDVHGMADGQRAGFVFISGNVFAWVGVSQEPGGRKIAWEGGVGPEIKGDLVWLRGTHDGDAARLWYSLDGKTYTDTGVAVQLKFASWKGARLGVFCYGANGGVVDVDYVRYRCGNRLAELEPGAVGTVK